MTDKEMEMSEAQVIDVEPKDEPDEEVKEETPEEGAVSTSTEVATLDEVVESLPEVPITPETGELYRMAQLAATFANAKLVPQALQGSPADVLLVMFTARSLGIDFTTGFRELYVIDGKVSMSTKQKLALVRQSRLADIWPDDGNDEVSATWYARRYDQPNVLYRSTFTLEDARRVDAKVDGKWTTLDQKAMYRQYPKRMLSWRALGYLLDDTCPEVATGIYSPDELGAATNEQGDVIDIAEIGPVVESDADKARAEKAQVDQELAPEEVRTAIAERLDALPEEILEECRARWKEKKLPHPSKLWVSQIRQTEAMLRGFEAKAKALAPAESPATDGGGPAESETPATQENAVPGAMEADSPPTDGPAEELLANGYPVDEDEQRKVIAAELRDTLTEVPSSVAEAATEFVAKMNWRKVDKGLVQRSEFIEGLHVDSRRMLAVAYLVAEYPEHGVPGLDEDWVREEES